MLLLIFQHYTFVKSPTTEKSLIGDFLRHIAQLVSAPA